MGSCLPLEDLWEDTESGHRIVKLFSWSVGQSTELMALSILKWLEKRSSLEMQRSPVEVKVRLRSRASSLTDLTLELDLLRETLEAHEEAGEACFGVSDTGCT